MATQIPPRPPGVLALAAVMATMLLTGAPAVAVQQPPNYDDLCQYLDPQIWPDCYGGGGVGDPCAGKHGLQLCLCQCTETYRRDKEQCNFIPPGPYHDSCIVVALDKFEKCCINCAANEPH